MIDPNLTIQLHTQLDKILAKHKKPQAKVDSIDPTREDKRKWRERGMVGFRNPSSSMRDY